MQLLSIELACVTSWSLCRLSCASYNVIVRHLQFYSYSILAEKSEESTTVVTVTGPTVRKSPSLECVAEYGAVRYDLLRHCKFKISCTISQLFDVTLRSGLRVTQSHWKWYHLKAWVRFSMYHFGGKARYWSKIYTPCIRRTRWGRCSRWNFWYRTITWLSQTDRASAAHTIRRGHLRDLEIYVKGHSRSLETEPLDRSYTTYC